MRGAWSGSWGLRRSGLCEGLTRQNQVIVGTINKLQLSFDPVKSERNIAERGLAFALAEGFEWSDALIAEDTRKDYQERRYQALGMMGDRLHMRVFTPREGAVHVISLRKANERARTRYAAQIQP